MVSIPRYVRAGLCQIMSLKIAHRQVCSFKPTREQHRVRMKMRLSRIIKFILEDGHCGILGADMNNVRFCGNTLKGRSSCGIVVKRGDSWEIQDNNLCDLTVSNPEGATIILDYNINSVVRENAGQAVGGSSAGDPIQLYWGGKKNV